MRRAIALPCAATIVFFAAHALAEEPIKELPALEARWKEARGIAAAQHFELAQRLERAGSARDAYAELMLVLLVEPDDGAARVKLGWKKDETGAWKGSPVLPGPPKKALDASLAQARATLHERTAARTSALARRALAGGLEADARRLAGIALDFSPDDKAARELLHHEKRGNVWLSPRAARNAAAFAKALARASAGEAKKAPDEDRDLQKLLGMGELARLETPHAIILATKAAPKVDLAALAKTAEAARAAFQWFLAGDGEGLTVEGETREHREARAPTAPPRFIFLGTDEHKLYVDRAIADKDEHAFLKKLDGSWAWVELPPARLFVVETSGKIETRAEWVAGTEAMHLAEAQLPPGTRTPALLVEGIRRFISGHVSGRADISYASVGETSTDRALEAEAFDAFRARGRAGLLLAPEGELRLAVSKGTNELERGDSAKALALVELLLERYPAAPLKLLSSIKTDEIVVDTLERATGKKVEELERELRAFVREEL